MRRLAIVASAALLLAGPRPASAAGGPDAGHGVNAARPPSAPAAILRVLDRTVVTVRFDETPVRDVVRYLETVTGLRIRAHLDARLDGLDPQTPITLAADAEPARLVLEEVLERCGELDPCTWQVRRGRLEIGTKARLAREKVVRIYPVRELLMVVPWFDNAPGLDLDAALNQGGTGAGGGSGGFGGSGGGGNGGGGGSVIIGEPGPEPVRAGDGEQAEALIEMLRDTVEPDHWAADGGDWARVRYHQGTLVVHAPPFIQRQIAGE